MTISLTHSTVVGVADDGTSPVGSDEWNAAHTITQATGKLLGRSTAGTGAVEEITPSADFSLASTALALKNLSAVGVYVITAYGATTGATDNSTAFQDAINAAYTAGGGIVHVPAGTWKLTAQVTIKSGVTLQGDGWRHDQNSETPSIGSIISIKWGNGAGNSTDRTKSAFIMNHNSAIKGLTIFYPDQAVNDYTPEEYGSTIRLYDSTAYASYPYLNNVTIENMMMLRCTVGIDARGSVAGPTNGGSNDYLKLINHCRFKNIKIASTLYGVRINEVYDWTILEDIEVQPGFISAGTYGLASSLRDYAQKNCIAFDCGRCDWLKLNHCTAWAVNVGVQISGGGPFTLIGCEFDACRACCIYFTGNCDPTYFKAVGCNFTAFDAIEKYWFDFNGTGTKYSSYVAAIANSTTVKGVSFDGCTLFGPSKGWWWSAQTTQTIQRISITNCDTLVSGAAGGADYAVNAGSSGVTDVIIANNFLKGLAGVSTGTIAGTTTNSGNIT